MEKITLELLVELTPGELADRAERLAEALRLEAEQRAELKQIQSTYRDEFKRFAAEIKMLAEAISTGQEQQPVECRVERQKDGGRLTIRTDTGEVVRSESPQPGQTGELFADG